MIDLMREFLVLATKMNYVSAASQLNVSQPTLSRHIAQLEKSLGFKLFDRNPLALTKQGSMFLEYASDIVDRFDLAIEKCSLVGQRSESILSVCMITADNLFCDIVHTAIDRLRKEVPSLVPRHYSNKRQTVLEAVAAGDADLGVLLAEPHQLPEGLACEWLADIPFYAWLHEGSSAFSDKPIPFEAVADHFLIHSTHRLFHTWHDGMEVACRRWNVELKTHVKDVDSIDNMLLSLKPDEVIFGSGAPNVGVPAPNNRHVFPVAFDDPELHYSAYLLYRTPERQAVRRLIELCHAEAAEKAGQ